MLLPTTRFLAKMEWNLNCRNLFLYAQILQWVARWEYLVDSGGSRCTQLNYMRTFLFAKKIIKLNFFVGKSRARPSRVRKCKGIIFCYLQGDIDELLWGKEYRYKQWITDMRKSMAAYEAKPERIEDGLKVNLSETLKKCPWKNVHVIVRFWF